MHPELSRACNIAYPIFELPPFAEEVNNFIRERARRDLPKAQFEGVLDPNNPDHFKEFWGMLDYRNPKIIELRYSHPEECDIIKRDGKIIGAEGGHVDFDMDDYEIMEHLVDYHSHPKDGVERFIMCDRRHVSSLTQVVKILKERGAPIEDLHFVLYLPHEDKTHWFKQEL